MARSVRTLCIAWWFLLGSTTALGQPPAAPESGWTPVRITWDQKIRMRDGVLLSAAVYRDPKQTRPLPVIMTMTPYIASHAAKQGVYFAQNGYVFVAVDSRGRGNSAGAFVPGQVEARDGYDVIEWIARQPWCDGQVATWGGSWLGFTQWSIAKEFPPHLRAMAPTAAVYPGVDYPQPNGIFLSYMLRWLAYVRGRALNDGLFNTTPLWINAEWEQVRSGRPFRDLESITGMRGTVFRTWLAHPREDRFWQAMTPRPAQYARIRLPILTITGHYDGDQLGALTYYDRHMAQGPRDAIARHWLVIGPWDHGGTRRPQPELGGLAFGPDAVPNMEELHRDWYDHVLKGKPVPPFLEERVACFIMGRNVWVHARDLAQIEGRPMTLHLDVSGAVPGDVTRSGALAAAPPATRASATLTADPRYLPPREELGVDNPRHLVDQRDAYRAQPGRIALHSAPFAAETVLAGRARLELQVTVDRPDADLWVDLYEVLADGSSALLAATVVRLRYRKGGTSAVPMVPGRPETIAVPPFSFFARSIAKGSRLRLVVDAGPQFGWQRNSHTGADLTTEPAAAGRLGKIQITTGPGNGGTLELPRPDDSLFKPDEIRASPR